MEQEDGRMAIESFFGSSCFKIHKFLNCTSIDLIRIANGFLQSKKDKAQGSEG